MEYVGNPNIKKLCNFYVNDLHLYVMLLPYISKQINEDVEITTIFKELKKQNMETILNKLNIQNKERILGINWFDSNKDSYEKIKKVITDGIKKNKKNTIIIGGDKEYILENSKNVINLIKNNNSDIKIINCYNIEEIGNEMKEILKDYDGVLNTLGEIETSEII